MYFATMISFDPSTRRLQDHQGNCSNGWMEGNDEKMHHPDQAVCIQSLRLEAWVITVHVIVDRTSHMKPLKSAAHHYKDRMNGCVYVMVSLHTIDAVSRTPAQRCSKFDRELQASTAATNNFYKESTVDRVLEAVFFFFLPSWSLLSPLYCLRQRMAIEEVFSFENPVFAGFAFYATVVLLKLMLTAGTFIPLHRVLGHVCGKRILRCLSLQTAAQVFEWERRGSLMAFSALSVNRCTWRKRMWDASLPLASSQTREWVKGLNCYDGMGTHANK